MGSRKSTEEAKVRDVTSHAIIFEGANLSEMEILFRIDFRTLKDRLQHPTPIQPCGKRGNALIYPVHEVAQRMGKLTEEQVDQKIRNLNHADLPKTLTKEFWAGQRSKQEYMLKAGQLWPTEKVVAEFGTIFKLVKMSSLLMLDAIERNQDVTPRQRETIKSLTDGFLRDVQKKVLEHVETMKRVQQANGIAQPTETTEEPDVQSNEDDDEL